MSMFLSITNPANTHRAPGEEAATDEGVAELGEREDNGAPLPGDALDVSCVHKAGMKESDKDLIRICLNANVLAGK